MSHLHVLDIAPTAPQTGTVIWLHGLGATCHDFEPVVPLLHRPDLRFLLPQAPERPVTVNGGLEMPAWYDILTLEQNPDRNDPVHIEQARGWLEELIAEQVAAGVPADRIVLVGFSQGGAMALHTGLRHAETLAGMVVLSAYLLLPWLLELEKSPANLETPILFGHGLYDPVVGRSAGRSAYDEVGHRRATWRDYPMEHEVCLEEIEDVRVFLGTVLA
jgi:phospholipase/carboxylesterase